MIKYNAATVVYSLREEFSQSFEHDIWLRLPSDTGGAQDCVGFPSGVERAVYECM